MSNNRESYSSPANDQVTGSVSSEGGEGEQRGPTVPMKEKGPSCTVGQSNGGAGSLDGIRDPSPQQR